MPAMSLPPGPRLPRLLQVLAPLRDPTGFWDSCARRYGPTWTWRPLGFGEWVYFSDPEVNREIFTGDPEVFRAGLGRSALGPIFGTGLLGANSLLLLEGAKHLRHRRILLPPFHGERIEAYARVMAESVTRAMATWPLGQPIALYHRFEEITLEVIMRTVFGLEAGPAQARLTHLLVDLLKIAYSPALWLMPILSTRARFGPWGRFYRLAAEIDRIIYDEIAARRAAGAAGEDILSLILAARDEDGQALSDTEIRDELVTMLIAGHDSTATALAWTFELVLAAPEVQARLEAEIDAVAGDGVFDRARLGQLEYCDAVIKESLRLQPPVPGCVRELAAPAKLGGYELPAGTRVLASAWLTQRRPDIYPDPLRFDPDRFLGVKPDPYAWLPFGTGLRGCIGTAYSLFEMKVVLATALSLARVRRAPGPRARPRLHEVMLVPSTGTMAILDGWKRQP